MIHTCLLDLPGGKQRGASAMSYHVNNSHLGHLHHYAQSPPPKKNGHATNGHFAQPLTMFIYNSKLKISTANSIAYSLKNVEPYTSQQTLVQHWSEYSIRRFHWKAVHFLELHTSLTLFMATHRCFSVKHSPLIETGLSFAFPGKSKCNLASAPKEIERH